MIVILFVTANIQIWYLKNIIKDSLNFYSNNNIPRKIIEASTYELFENHKDNNGRLKIAANLQINNTALQ
jgi:hypothetical protein